MKSPQVRGRSYKALANEAQAFRQLVKRAGFFNNGYLDIVKLYDHLAGVLPDKFKFDVVRRNDFESPTAEGLTFSDGRIYIAEDVYIQAVGGAARPRFTMAHELCHWLLHTDEIVFSRDGESVPVFRDPEWQANTFAGLLLVSIDDIEICNLDASEVAKRCGISRQAAAVRIDQYRKRGV